MPEIEFRDKDHSYQTYPAEPLCIDVFIDREV